MFTLRKQPHDDAVDELKDAAKAMTKVAEAMMKVAENMDKPKDVTLKRDKSDRAIGGTVTPQ